MIRKETKNNFAIETIQLEARIRPCTEADLPLLEWDGQFTADRPIIDAAFADQMRDDGLMLICEANSYPVGQVWIDWLQEREANAGYLWAFRVVTPLQKLGLGQRLIREAERCVLEYGYPRVRLAVDKANEAARRFYHRTGYKAIGELQNSSQYLLQKEIDLAPANARARCAEGRGRHSPRLRVGQSRSRMPHPETGLN